MPPRVTMSARAGGMHQAQATTRRQQFPVMGKIRPGIKVPTKAAQEHQGMMDAYHRGLEVGASFDDIEKAMKQANPKFNRSPLTPRNARYFRVVPSEFPPGVAKTIMDLHGEQREGDSRPHLYSFPVVFPSDDIDLVFREQFEAWTASQILRWSEPDPGTGELMCMKRQEVKPDKSKRRRWGGRQNEVVGPCDPNACDLFGAGQCKHMGSLYFWVPGVSGVGVIELEFSSVYASMGVLEVLETVKAGLGRIRGMINGKPLFRISKIGRDVSMMDWEKGQALRQHQYIIQLDADGLDMTRVLSAQEAPMLAGPANVVALPSAEPAREPDGEPQSAAPVAAGNTAREREQPEPKQTKPNQPEPEPEQTEPEQPEPDSEAATVADLRRQLGGILKELKWSGDDLKEWMAGQNPPYIEDDVHNAEQLQAIVATLEPLAKPFDPNEAPF